MIHYTVQPRKLVFRYVLSLIENARKCIFEVRWQLVSQRKRGHFCVGNRISRPTLIVLSLPYPRKVMRSIRTCLLFLAWKFSSSVAGAGCEVRWHHVLWPNWTKTSCIYPVSFWNNISVHVMGFGGRLFIWKAANQEIEPVIHIQCSSG